MKDNNRMSELPVVPGYKFIKLLGHGGAADVWLGVQETLGRNVAIKILRNEESSDPHLNRRFLKEGETAAKLIHNNILTIIDVGFTGRYYYMVMEYLPGNLREYILSLPLKRVEPLRAEEILFKLADALKYAHGESVVHRDIKTDNILIRRNGEPVIGDFGIARDLDNSKGLTSTGVIMGTPDYMSPEQCRGNSVNHKTDFYSLGIVFYEMLTGKVPYKADSAAGILIQHMDSPIPVLEGEIAVYQVVINALMAKDPLKRPATTSEIRELINRSSKTVAFGGNEVTKLMEPLENSDVKQQEGNWTFGENEDSGDFTIGETISEEPVEASTKSRSSWIVIPSILLLISGGVFLYKYFNSSENPGPLNSEVSSVVKEPELKIPLAEEKKTEPSKEELLKQQYKDLINKANLALKEQDFKKAGELVEKASAIFDTEEVKLISRKIDKKLKALEDREFNHYIGLASQLLKEKNFKEAGKTLARAEKIRKNSTSSKLKKLINKGANDLAALRARKREVAAKDKRAFRRAVAGNTVYSYEKYLKKYPEGKYSKTALERLKQLQQSSSLEYKVKEDLLYKDALESGTIEAHQKYLDSFPGGRYKIEIKRGLEGIKKRIAKETEVPLDIQKVEFFNSTLPNGKGETSFGGGRIPSTEARYIFTKLHIINKLHNIGDRNNSIKIVYKNSEKGVNYEINGKIFQYSTSKSSKYSRGIGWKEPGKWLKGKYVVEVFINSKRVAKSNFTIF